MRVLFWITCICAIIYIIICTFFYFDQEQLIFPGVRVAANYIYKFPVTNREYKIKTADGNIIDGYLFKTTLHVKGLIFYLHGNGNNVHDWSNAVQNYTSLGYDAFAMDYPGYGKSSGRIASLSQLFNAVQTAYDTLKRIYPEDRIIIMGYSIGTGPAAWLAKNNHPAQLVLLAPYFSIGDLASRRYPFLPVSLILKYPINTYQYLPQVSAPVTIFHGTADQVIYYGSSLKLKPFLKPGDTLITLAGQDHFHYDDNPVYLNDVRKLLR